MAIILDAPLEEMSSRNNQTTRDNSDHPCGVFLIYSYCLNTNNTIMSFNFNI